MKIWQKLILAFSCSSFLLATIGFLTIQIDKRVESDTNETIHGIVGEAKVAGQIFIKIQLIQELNQDFLIKNAKENLPEEEKKEYLQKMCLRLKELEEEIKNGKQATLNQKEIINSSEKNLTQKNQKIAREERELQELRELVEEIKISRQEYELLLKNSQLNSEEALVLGERLRSRISRVILPMTQEYYQDSLSEITEAELKTQELAKENIIIIKNYVWFSFSLSLVLIIYVYLSIYFPIEKLKIATSKLAENFSNYKPIQPVNPNDELGEVITYFNKTIAELQKKLTSKSYLDKIVNSINQSLIVIDNQNKITQINQNIKEILGYSELELISQPINKILAGDNPLSLEELIKLDDLSTRCFDLGFVTVRNKLVFLTVYFSNLFNESGEKEGTICLGIPAENLSLKERIALQTSKAKVKELNLDTFK